MLKKISLLMLLIFVAYLTTNAQTPPPTNLVATLKTDHHLSVNLEWQYQSTTPVKFLVYKKLGAIADSGNFVKIFTTFSKKFFDDHVVANKTYSYYVTAMVGTVESVPSNNVEVLVVPPVIAWGKASGTLFADSTNEPIIKGSVQFFQTLGHGPCIVAQTDSFGKFNVRLLAGQYYIYSSARGYFGEYYDNVTLFSQATAITVNANDSLVYNIGLKKYLPPVTYTLTGWVKDASGNPKAATLTAYPVNKINGIPHGEHGLSARTDSLGNYKFNGLKLNDTIVIYISPKDRAYLPQYYNNKSTFAAADKIAITGNIADINVTVEAKPVYANGISGSVKDSAGTVALKAKVYAYKRGTTGAILAKYFVKTDTVTGEYSFANMEPGQYILLAEARGYKSTYFKYDGTPTWNWRQADSVVVTATGVVPNINFNLRAFNHTLPGSPVPIVFGNIKEQSGNILDFALAYVVDNNGEVLGSSVSDLDGFYQVDGVPTGNYNIVVNRFNYQDATIAGITGETSTGNLLDITVTPLGATSVGNSTEIVADYKLSQNYPNPFNPSTKIYFSIPKEGFVTLAVFNAIGQKIATLVNDNVKAGNYEVNFDGSKLSSGIYFYSINAGNFSVTKKMLLVK